MARAGTALTLSAKLSLSSLTYMRTHGVIPQTTGELSLASSQCHCSTSVGHDGAALLAKALKSLQILHLRQPESALLSTPSTQ
jgi:hypothetical protein